MEERILNKAKEMFFSFGIKSVTMDDIAKELGVSKKTIYQFFADKKALVQQVFSDLVASHDCKVKSSGLEAQNAVHEVCLQVRSIIEIFQSMKPGIFFEVQKYFPETWKMIDSHKNECVMTGILQNLQRGIDEKLYREELNIRLTAHLRLVQLNSILNLNDFPADKFSYPIILTQLSELYLYGISTPEGQKLIIKHLKPNN